MRRKRNDDSQIDLGRTLAGGFIQDVSARTSANGGRGGFGGKDSKLSLAHEVGGRFLEHRADGTEYEIGLITAYEPPSRVAFTWRAPSWDVITQVEIRFTAEAGGTRVELEHSGWEQSEQTLDAQKNYNSGWDKILGHYQAVFDPAGDTKAQARNQ